MKNIIQTILPLFLIFTFIRCNGGRTFSDMKGLWGGEHIEMNVSDSLAVIEYDCAHGTMNELIYFDKDGNFEAAGTHILEAGMVKLKTKREPVKVKYSGKITDNRMVLTVYDFETNNELGAFDLKFGEKGYINKCQ